jgi:hypothetical protein
MFATMLQDFIIALIKTLLGVITFIISIPFFFVVFLLAALKSQFEIQRKNIKRKNSLRN